MIEETRQDAKQSMDKAVEALKRDLTRVRTGRATPALLDGVRAEYYGAPTPINQMAASPPRSPG